MAELAFREFVENVRSWDKRQREAFLRLLLVDGIGSVLARRLLGCLQEPMRILAASEAELAAVPGIGPKLARRIKEEATEDHLKRELALCRRESVRLIWADEPDYPTALVNIPVPPLVLWVRGELRADDQLAVAVVGSRAATAYGLRQTERIVSGLTAIGFTIVSGLARGIDAAAHRAALRHGGRTIAVLASGLHDIYPPEHYELAEQIASNGALISESPMTRAPKAGLFPMRNRIISGLSLAVVVVEAAQRSGALITVAHALEQGKEVFAVPGPADSPLSQGCHRLIREGAYLAETADDVFEVIRPLAVRLATTLRGQRPVAHPFEADLSESEHRVLDAVGNGPVGFDDLVLSTGLPAGELRQLLTRLEIRRFVQRMPGNRYRRA